MNRLQLVQRLWQEASASGSKPTDTRNQTGENQRLIDWIDSAYQDIQDLHSDWDFLRNDFSFSTIEDQRSYTKAAISLTELNFWKVDDIRIYESESDETEMVYEPWDSFKRSFLFGSLRSVTGRPFYFSINQSGDFYTDSLADAVYTINGEYFKRAQAMSSTGTAANTDTPLIPTQYQMAIVWKALMYYGAYEGADDVYAHGEKEYMNMLSRLERNQLPMKSFLGKSLI